MRESVPIISATSGMRWTRHSRYASTPRSHPAFYGMTLVGAGAHHTTHHAELHG